MKGIYPDEKNVVLDKNSVERKSCINIESKIFEITIELYSCHDINMKFLVVVTPLSIYQYVPLFFCCSCCRVWGTMLAHLPKNLHATQFWLSLRYSHRVVLIVNVGLHLYQVSTSGHSGVPGAVVWAASVVSYSLSLFCFSILIDHLVVSLGKVWYLTLPPIYGVRVADITSEHSHVLDIPYILSTFHFLRNYWRKWHHPPFIDRGGVETWGGGGGSPNT